MQTQKQSFLQLYIFHNNALQDIKHLYPLHVTTYVVLHINQRSLKAFSQAKIFCNTLPFNHQIQP